MGFVRKFLVPMKLFKKSKQRKIISFQETRKTLKRAILQLGYPLVGFILKCMCQQFKCGVGYSHCVTSTEDSQEGGWETAEQQSHNAKKAGFSEALHGIFSIPLGLTSQKSSRTEPKEPKGWDQKVLSSSKVSQQCKCIFTEQVEGVQWLSGLQREG